MATYSSQYSGVSRSNIKSRFGPEYHCWQVKLRIQGHLYHFGNFPARDAMDEQEAAMCADKVRWQLQDYLPKKPRYNFPELIEEEYISPSEGVHPKVRELRESFLVRRVPTNPPHHKLFFGDAYSS